MQPTDIDRLRYLIRMLTPPNPSDSEDNVTQNLKWYEQQRAQREEKRILNNAIRDVQYMTVDQQLNWAKENRELAGSVIRHLRAEVQLEVILHDERENEKEDEEFKRIEAAQRSLKKDVHGFLRSILPPGRRVPARLVLSKAAERGISRRTLYRVKKQQHIRSARVGFGGRGYFVWFFEDTNT